MQLLRYIIISILVLSYSTINAADSLKIGTIERQPFSYEKDGEWEGFSIDLWKEIAERNEFEYEFEEYEDFSKMIENTQEKKNDLSVANISITAQREKVLDYSSPIYDSGLNILALSENSEILSFYSKYSSKVYLGLKILGLILFILTHYFFVSNVRKGHITALSYPREIIPIFFEVLVQIKETMGLKLLIPFSGILAVLLVALFSQKFTLLLNDMGADKAGYTNLISYLELKDLKVGVTNGSVGKSFLERKEIETQGHPSLPELYDKLESKEIEYLVADEPVLRYHSRNNPVFQVVGKIFNKDQYAILFPQYKDSSNDDFIKTINVSILEMKEDGTYDRIYKEYFE